jgi:surface protein
MFAYAEAFNQPLNTWDVSNVVDMDYMFFQAFSFNQLLNSWDVSSIKTMA